MWEVDMGIPFSEEYNAYDIAAEIEAHPLVGMASGAGSGFGYRDMQFEYNTRVQARNAETVIRLILRAHDIEIALNPPPLALSLNTPAPASTKAYVNRYSWAVLP